MAKAKHDYDGQDFYTDIALYAGKGFSDAEIADMLDLDPDVFGRMKNGRYDKWTEEENKRRSENIGRVLARARRKVNAIVRGVYLKAAIGGKIIKTKTSRAVMVRCPLCGGLDSECPQCGGTGQVALTDKSVVQETESEMPPNLQAMTTWLHHHDPEWRKAENGEDDDDVPTNIKHGIEIDKWIQDQVDDKDTEDIQPAVP